MSKTKRKYTLVGVNGNAYAIMGYTATALKETGHDDLVEKMYDEATSGDYYHLIDVCDDYIAIANGEGKEDENTKDSD